MLLSGVQKQNRPFIKETSLLPFFQKKQTKIFLRPYKCSTVLLAFLSIGSIPQHERKVNVHFHNSRKIRLRLLPKLCSYFAFDLTLTKLPFAIVVKRFATGRTLNVYVLPDLSFLTVYERVFEPSCAILLYSPFLSI